MSKIDDKDRFYYNRDFLGSTSGRSLRILSEYIALYLKPFSHEVLQIRGQSLNLFILLKLILKFPTKNLLHEYVKIYIETVKPKN